MPTPKKSKESKKRSADYQMQMVVDFKKSKLSASAFAKKTGISRTNLLRWNSKMGIEGEIVDYRGGHNRVFTEEEEKELAQHFKVSYIDAERLLPDGVMIETFKQYFVEKRGLSLHTRSCGAARLEAYCPNYAVILFHPKKALLKL
eukprot:TRINITY_DN1321_c0_g2_i4.p1 TRINITY_DN1321_c0_g2~~TRINITY_DN1321_c0_g2_i4.p1  ORF type:complete len:146 (+),score=33.14 TRINITY_DN1321_c0_g2_i4:67-504(+)